MTWRGGVNEAEMGAALRTLTGEELGEDGRAELHRHAEAGLCCEALVLLRQGARVDARDAEQRTPLMYAAMWGHGRVVGLLLKEAADWEARDAAGRTPLSHAAQHGRVEAMRRLIKQGAHPASGDNEGIQPLLWAALGGATEAVRELLAMDPRRVDPGARNHAGMTALHLAAAFGHDEACAALLDREPALLEARCNQGVTPLLLAAHKGRSATCKFLLGRGAELATRSKRGGSPLHAAAQQGHLGTVELLLRHGSAVNAADYSGVVPLHYAAANGHFGVACALLESGADLWALDQSDRTPVHLASALPDAEHPVRVLFRVWADGKHEAQRSRRLAEAALHGFGLPRDVIGVCADYVRVVPVPAKQRAQVACGCLAKNV